ncbi:SPOR domain-containing protein [Paraburkholderia sp. MMS20-SJTR3]|uniref:SPOR domain-containing protein n=1 Tax=Paraburkholderia sejongensis TaxID=2886946 RepID=A0ABS8K4D6_9BURK|nr:SPOR domain-containing protein [Paraburkholderia sp. MMS20-SJTR3]MCC8396774.1 SPOR domain-containing protein [Paraburkholderia sp. MMS20-SJTR3]
MGIFSFGKKDDAPSRRGANTSSTRAARGERVERRTRRTERPVDADAMLLDPTLPEKQRARRRLVGAIALVAAAVIILPMVLDSHPKPVTDDISIDIPSRPAPKLAKSRANEDVQAGVAPDNPPAADAGLAASGLAPATTATAAASAAKPATQAAQTAQSAQATQSTQANAAKQATNSTAATAPATAAAPKPAAKPPTQALAVNTAPAASAKPTKTPAAATPSDDDTNSTTASADANSGTPASPPGSRFAVQLGAFANEASARNWVTKLKAAGVPAYTEHRKQADGSTLTLLRAGPFADRAAATEAIAKVRGAGLMAGSNGSGAQ